MGSQLATLFSEGRYEEVLAAAAAEPRTGAANPLARYLEAQAHYHLGEYFACAERVEETIAKHTADAPLEIRHQLASLLAKTLLQDADIELLTVTVPSLDGVPIDVRTNTLFDQWRIGRLTMAKRGLLLVVAAQ